VLLLLELLVSACLCRPAQMGWHLIVTIAIESTFLETRSVAMGKLCFVDLAGSDQCVPFYLSLPPSAHVLLWRFACAALRKTPRSRHTNGRHVVGPQTL
jgi:hypothetical protein